MSSYWIRRHKKWKGSIRAVGSQSLTESANQEDYLCKKGFLKSVLPRIMANSEASVLRVWDAGSGSGYLTRFLVEQGFQVYASDVSEDALQSLSEGMEVSEVKVGPISTTSWSHSFDICFCLDVLYHVMGDAEWEKSLRAMAAQTNTLVILEHLVEKADTPNVHIRFRTLDMYQKVLQGVGMEMGLWERLLLPQSHAELDLMVFQKEDVCLSSE